MSPPFKVGNSTFYGVGISREGSLIDLGVDQGIVRNSGAWYTYEGDQPGQGKENAGNLLWKNLDLANEIEKLIKELASAALVPMLPPALGERQR